MNRDENDFETIAIFNNSFDPHLAFIKSLLDEAGINYFLINENFMSINPLPVAPYPISIELRVDKKRVKEALEIVESFK